MDRLERGMVTSLFDTALVTVFYGMETFQQSKWGQCFEGKLDSNRLQPSLENANGID